MFVKKTLNPSGRRRQDGEGGAKLRHHGVEHVDLSPETIQLLLLPSQFPTKIGHLLLFKPLLMVFEAINGLEQPSADLSHPLTAYETKKRLEHRMNIKQTLTYRVRHFHIRLNHTSLMTFFDNNLQ
jgi:hypothetical protein